MIVSWEDRVENQLGFKTEWMSGILAVEGLAFLHALFAGFVFATRWVNWITRYQSKTRMADPAVRAVVVRSLP